MKKIILGIVTLLLANFAHAQNGLENIIVEKYYVSNATDGTYSSGTLPAGSATFRIYADMSPGYKFQAAYGVPTHTMTITSTTSFFNNTDYLLCCVFCPTIFIHFSIYFILSILLSG